jgi:ketosteroid isomerase-like protein
MSRREAIDALLAAIETGDVDEIVKHVHPDFVATVPPEMSAEPDSYTGAEGIARYFALFRETVDDLQPHMRWLEDAGEWTLAEVRITGRGRESGLPFDLTGVSAILMRGDKALRMQGYPSVEEARAALT